MTSHPYSELELLICLHFPMAASRTRRACHFDVASGLFKWPGSVLMWLHGTLKNPFGRKEFIKPIECSDVLVQCQWLAAVSVNVCGAAEVPEEQVGK